MSEIIRAIMILLALWIIPYTIVSLLMFWYEHLKELDKGEAMHFLETGELDEKKRSKK